MNKDPKCCRSCFEVQLFQDPNGWIDNSWKRKGRCLYSVIFSRKQFIKGGNPTVTQLLNLAEVQGVSANADKLKYCLDRSFDLIKQFCGGDDMLKKFISICTDGASANISCNDSLFTRLAEEHPHLIPFWCIVHQLELAIKDSIGDGLLHDIKECLLKFIPLVQ